MSVANELTSDVAAFVLKNETLHAPKNTRQLLVEFHSILRKLTRDERRQRAAKLACKHSSLLDKKATSLDN
jgi:hypothetical protein